MAILQAAVEQLALAAAVELSAHNTGSVLLAAGTDGTDGPTGAAGAIVDAGSVARIMAAGLDPADCLQRADAAVCLEASGDLLYTGPPGTNVTDMVIGLNPPAPEGIANGKPV